MSTLQNCVIRGEKLYCWDTVNKRYVAANIVIDPNEDVPEPIIKEIVKKRYKLKERD